MQASNILVEIRYDGQWVGVRQFRAPKRVQQLLEQFKQQGHSGTMHLGAVVLDLDERLVPSVLYTLHVSQVPGNGIALSTFLSSTHGTFLTKLKLWT